MCKFQAACKTNPDDQEALRAIDLLYDAALVSSGFTVNSQLMAWYYCYESDLFSILKLDHVKKSCTLHIMLNIW